MNKILPIASISVVVGILLVILVLMVVLNRHKRKDNQSEKYTMEGTNSTNSTNSINSTNITNSTNSITTKDIADVSLQYNIVKNPIREQIFSLSVQGSPPEPPNIKDIENFRNELNKWYTNASLKKQTKPMDKWCKIAIEAALDSISIGNWGIGNVLCYMPKGTENNPEKWVEILRGGNRFFTRNPTDILDTNIKNVIPRFDSHGHGEMVILDVFEDRLSQGYYDKSSPNYTFDKTNPIDFRKRSETLGYGMPDGIVLFTQLNSCQMCLSRIGNSGLARCYWIAPDTAGGAAHRLCDAVPAYFNMLNRQLHTVADASPEMIQFAFEAFAGPDNRWVSYCTWKLGMLGSPENMSADYKYCPGQYYANNLVGQNAKYDWGGFFRTVDPNGGPTLQCAVTPPKQ